MTEHQPLRVLIADDHDLVRTGFRIILQAEDDLTVVAEAKDGAAAVRLSSEHQPDVVLMDVQMPGMDGLAATRAIVGNEANCAKIPAVLILTTFDSDEYLFEALRAGASGFLLKDTPPADLVSAVRDAAQDNLRFSPGVLKRIVAAAASTATAAPAPENRLTELSERERAVARAVARGLTNTEISTELFVSVATVKTHIANAFIKLDVTNRVQLAVTVLQSGPHPG